MGECAASTTSPKQTGRQDREIKATEQKSQIQPTSLSVHVLLGGSPAVHQSLCDGVKERKKRDKLKNRLCLLSAVSSQRLAGSSVAPGQNLTGPLLCLKELFSITLISELLCGFFPKAGLAADPSKPTVTHRASAPAFGGRYVQTYPSPCLVRSDRCGSTALYKKNSPGSSSLPSKSTSCNFSTA